MKVAVVQYRFRAVTLSWQAGAVTEGEAGGRLVAVAKLLAQGLAAVVQSEPRIASCSPHALGAV